MVVFGVFSISPLATQAATYYIDAEDGNDSNSGLSEGDAFQTISKVNTITPSLNPGDEVLFKRGQTHTSNETLNLSGINGTETEKIVISAYGSGSDPILHILDFIAIRVQNNTSYLTLQNLYPESQGFEVISFFNGTFSNVTLENIKINEGGFEGVRMYPSATTTNLIIKDTQITFTSVIGTGIRHQGVSQNDTFENELPRSKLTGYQVAG